MNLIATALLNQEYTGLELAELRRRQSLAEEEEDTIPQVYKPNEDNSQEAKVL